MNHQQQAESYAKAVTKNETYREYLKDAFLAGVEATKAKTMNITKEALIERGFVKSGGCYESHEKKVTEI